jgi:cytosine/adenosine deaminase-related metal-dependent hydrolase
MYRKWDGKEGRVWVWLSPRTPGACSDSLYKELSELKEEYDVGLTMHLAEVKEDIEYFRSRGTTPAKFVKQLGLVGPKTVYVHCVWFEDEDIEIFAKTGTSISHNPSSNAKLGSGIAPISKMVRKGVNVTIGTDGGPSNDDYDMIREMKMALLLQKVRELDPTNLELSTVLRMATINGARALGLERELGSLEVGKKADFIVIDIRKPHLTPTISPLSNLIYSGTGMDVKDVVVDGRFIKKDGKVLSLNEEEVLERAEEHARRLYERVEKEPWFDFKTL